MQNAERDARTAEIVAALASKRPDALAEYRIQSARLQAEKAQRDRAFQDDMRRG